MDVEATGALPVAFFSEATMDYEILRSVINCLNSISKAAYNAAENLYYSYRDDGLVCGGRVEQDLDLLVRHVLPGIEQDVANVENLLA
jgi:hypothetical protein